jgi:hypothetical protein
MTDSFAAARRPVDNAPGKMAMPRLADRIAGMAGQISVDAIVRFIARR